MPMHRPSVFISVGSNLGDRLRNCQGGIEALAGLAKTRLDAVSRFYETEPTDYLEQRWFINAAARIETGLDPFQLLVALKEIENSAGRKEGGIRFGPRALDLDIILFGAMRIDKPHLVIPHPRMHQRRFVLRPICDIDPHVLHPGLKRSARQLLDGLKDDAGQGIRSYGDMIGKGCFYTAETRLKEDAG
jgi:2-amino-4-hydroxy-6-hydroxymethyldihydropteridine diphosphokinase